MSLLSDSGATVSAYIEAGMGFAEAVPCHCVYKPSLPVSLSGRHLSETARRTNHHDDSHIWAGEQSSPREASRGCAIRPLLLRRSRHGSCLLQLYPQASRSHQEIISQVHNAGE